MVFDVHTVLAYLNVSLLSRKMNKTKERPVKQSEAPDVEFSNLYYYKSDFESHLLH